MTDERPTGRDEGVLSPSDLDIADSEYIAEIEEGRYVVATGEGSPDPAGAAGADRSSTDPTARYGLDIEVSVDGKASRYRTRSDDVVAVFSDLMRWYATRVDAELSPETVLRILVAESELSIGPRSTVETAMRRHELAAEDSIGDLLDALSETQN